MPQFPTFPPVAPSQFQTCAFDFGDTLPNGVTLTGTPTINILHHIGIDPSPGSRIRSGPSVGTVPISQGGSGISNTAVIFQVGNCLNGVVYTIEVVCNRLDSDVAEGWAWLPCVGPT
jgi:hypothetical protein